MEEIYFVESLTNGRLREEVGDISLVAKEDRLCGEGTSVVMASFTHISKDCPSRFTNGEYGVYYAARDIETAIEETAYHRERFLSFTKEPSCKVTMRVYQSKNITKPLKDIRGEEYKALMSPNDYMECQKVGQKLKEMNSWGIVFPSVRKEGGECVAIFRPPAIPVPVNQTEHLEYVWDGSRIVACYKIGEELRYRRK